MKRKLLAVISLAALVAVTAPALAQDNDETAGIDADIYTAEEAPEIFSDEEEMVGEGRRQGWEKSRVLREAAESKGNKGARMKSAAANEHRGAVAAFVKGILDVADRQALGGIGEQVREIARQQNASEDKVTQNLERIRNRSRVRNFLFGADFGKIKEVKKEMQEAQKRLGELEKAKNDVADPADKTALENQIDAFRTNIDKILADVSAEEKKFSLFGWVKKILND